MTLTVGISLHTAARVFKFTNHRSMCRRDTGQLSLSLFQGNAPSPDDSKKHFLLNVSPLKKPLLASVSTQQQGSTVKHAKHTPLGSKPVDLIIRSAAGRLTRLLIKVRATG